MYRFHYYTAEENLEGMKRFGFVLPKSDPFCRECFKTDFSKRNTSNKVLNLINFEKYIVGLLDIGENWKNSDLLGKLFRNGDAKVLLELNFEEKEGVFVRELDFLTPHSMEQNYKRNFWEENLEPIDFVLKRPFRKYIKSTICFDEYEGNYKIPEVWIPYEIKLN